MNNLAFLTLLLSVFSIACTDQSKDLQIAVQRFKQDNPYSMHIVRAYFNARTVGKDDVADLIDLTISKFHDSRSTNVELKIQFRQNNMIAIPYKPYAKQKLIDSMYYYLLYGDKTLDAFTQCTKISDDYYCDTYIDERIYRALEQEHEKTLVK